MTRSLCFGMLRTREDKLIIKGDEFSFFTNISRAVANDRCTEVAIKVATIILGCIFSMLFRDFRARGPISILTPPIVALTEFFHADAVASAYPLPES